MYVGRLCFSLVQPMGIGFAAMSQVPQLIHSKGTPWSHPKNAEKNQERFQNILGQPPISGCESSHGNPRMTTSFCFHMWLWVKTTLGTIQ